MDTERLDHNQVHSTQTIASRNTPPHIVFDGPRHIERRLIQCRHAASSTNEGLNRRSFDDAIRSGDTDTSVRLGFVQNNVVFDNARWPPLGPRLTYIPASGFA